jgi:hypothetical protein
MDQEDRVMKSNTSRAMKHNPILQGDMPSMQRRESGMDEREDLLSTVPIPDILLATQSIHHSSFLVPLFLNLGMRFRLKGRAVTPHLTDSVITFTKS